MTKRCRADFSRTQPRRGEVQPNQFTKLTEFEKGREGTAPSVPTFSPHQRRAERDAGCGIRRMPRALRFAPGHRGNRRSGSLHGIFDGGCRPRGVSSLAGGGMFPFSDRARSARSTRPDRANPLRISPSRAEPDFHGRIPTWRNSFLPSASGCPRHQPARRDVRRDVASAWNKGISKK